MNPRCPQWLACPVFLAASLWSAQALQIRTYSAARHDRFTGFPGSPVVNGSAWFDGSQYSGVGWSASAIERQFALISPQHILMANHYSVAPGSLVRFVSTSGSVVTATVDTVTNVLKDGLSTDLTIARLTAPVVGVNPVPYLNLPADAHYETSNLQVFGHQTGGGTHPVVGQSILEEIYTESFFGTPTRMCYFPYKVAAGDQDDCHVFGGDSGSPTFASTRNGPALVGTHSLLGSDDPPITVYYTIDTFVPHYISELNALMSPAYAMTPVFPNPTPLVLTPATTPDPFRHLMAGTATFTFENAGATDALNASVTLTFPATAPPTSVAASGWVVDAAGPLVWTFHRATLAAAATTDFVASWASVPAISTLPVTVRHLSDGSPQQTAEYDLEPTVSYAAWSNGLAQPGTAQDPDGDGRANLFEYAFGGSATSGSDFLAPAVVAGNVIGISGGTATLRFPVRSDFQVRGLSYVLEFSDDLSNWSAPQPAGTTAVFAAYSPAVPGFTERIVTFPADESRKFVRVRVTLDESAPGMAVP